MTREGQGAYVGEGFFLKPKKELTEGVGRAFQAEGTAWAKLLGWEALSVKSRETHPATFKPHESL